MRAVITNPVGNVPISKKSHVLGWAQLWQDQLSADINHKCTSGILDYDIVYVDHGVNYGGSLNLFGGANKDIFDKLSMFIKCENVISLDHDMPDLGAQLKGRIGSKTTYEGITPEWCDMVSEALSGIERMDQHMLVDMDGVTLGDSHALAFSGPNDIVLRNDGKTLHGALKETFVSMFGECPIEGRITLCFGSIDIRHHLLRRRVDMPSFIGEYVKEGLALERDYDCEVLFCNPVPIEFEGRRIPKTGYYKKQPFFGSQEQRHNITMQFVDELEIQVPDRIVGFPKEWYSMDPEEYAKTYMELGSSFHIAPPYYRRKNWGLDD